MGYFRIFAAIPGFFVSSLILMALWGVISPNVGIDKINYPMAMLVTITLWLAVAPLTMVGRMWGRGRRHWRRQDANQP